MDSDSQARYLTEMLEVDRKERTAIMSLSMSPGARLVLLIAQHNGGMVRLQQLVDNYHYQLHEAQASFDEAQRRVYGRVLRDTPRTINLKGDA